MEPGAEIQGTVYSAATGAPLPRVQVCSLFVEEAEEAWLVSRCLRTSATGSYALFGLWTDSYKVVFSPEPNEFFGGIDGYLVQFFNNQPTLVLADPLGLTAPEVRTGIDAHLTLFQSVSPPPPLAVSPALVKPKPRHRPHKRCRPGFRKKKVMGKRRCMKTHKKHRHSHKQKGGK